MSLEAWIVMGIVTGTVWGGLALIVALALRKESAGRGGQGGAQPPPDGSTR